MFPALGGLLGVDPAEVETAALKETIEQKIVDCHLPTIALSNGFHVDLVNLEKEGRLTVQEVTQLKVTWVLGRWVQWLLSKPLENPTAVLLLCVSRSVIIYYFTDFHPGVLGQDLLMKAQQL
jgi:hypothetical protein